jgi:hypothetical protein
MSSTFLNFCVCWKLVAKSFSLVETGMYEDDWPKSEAKGT